jgi:hypothetical protein
MKHFLPRLACLILLPALLSGGTAFAERIYKWVDDNGKVQYGDRVPPQYASKERTVIDDQGRIVKIYPAAKTPEEKAAADALAKQKAKQEKLDQQQSLRDHTLLSTYSSEQDMLMARDGKVASVETLIQLTNSRIEIMKKRLAELTEDAAEFERSGKKLPEGLLSQIKTIRDQIQKNEDFANKKRLEKEQIAHRFDEDIKRYRELTSRR